MLVDFLELCFGLLARKAERVMSDSFLGIFAVAKLVAQEVDLEQSATTRR